MEARSAGYIWGDSGWQVQGWAKNLTNKQYIFGAAANGPIPTGEAGAPTVSG